ncbi:MAG: hypothetical protein P4M14_04270 [Gammaproteobacteria bacterium]|nr:hypothetical protein [Gammaproteobacteria bacterium]
MNGKASTITPGNTMRMSTPWTAVILYSLTIMMNWLYAYLVQSQPAIIMNSWTVVFPLMSYFYLSFSGISVVGIYQRTCWGFCLGYITIFSGAVTCAISYLLAFHFYPEIFDYFILILVLNFAVVVYMVAYYQNNPMNPD